MWATRLVVISLMASRGQTSRTQGRVSLGDTYLPPSSGYLPPPAASNKYLPPPASSNKYLPPPAASNKYLPPPPPTNKYLPPPSPTNTYLPPLVSQAKDSTTNALNAKFPSTNEVPIRLPSKAPAPSDVVVTTSVDAPVKLPIKASINPLTPEGHLGGVLDDKQNAGFCPRQRLTRSCVLVKAAPATCLADADCADHQKCCAKNCALQCVDAVVSPKTCAAITCNQADEECVDLDTPSESGPVCIGHTKPGQCYYHGQDCPFRNVRCRDDASCPGNQLCCNLGCGRSCSRPVTPSQQHGFCPPSATYQRPTQCSLQCHRDADCAAGHKCCDNACGRVCLPAVVPLVTCKNRNCPETTVCEMSGAESICKAKS